MSNDDVGGKSLATQELRLNVALPARILDHTVAGFDAHLVGGHVLDHVGEQPRRDDGLAFGLDVGGDARLDRKLHVGGVQLEPAVAGLEQDA